jgi:hypothetical protein
VRLPVGRFVRSVCAFESDFTDSPNLSTQIVAEVGKESAAIKAGGALNASKGLQLLSKSRTDAFKAMDIFKTGVKVKS